ncbi:MAG UNVERIFIED_CONTAM: hypothetical protein LVR18_05685 [Planctomycetaceae bacterium]
MKLACRGLQPAYFLAGVVALGLEVVWLRFLGIVSSNSTITFSFSLAAYLLGMGCGSLLLYPVLRRFVVDDSVPGKSGNGALRIFSLANLSTGLLTLVTWPVLHRAAALNYEWITVPAATGQLTLGHILQTEAMLVFGLMFLPALSMGLVYPAVCDAAEGHELSRSRWAGTAGFLGTLGAAVGVLLMSLWVIPLLGLHGSLAMLISAAVGLGLWIRPCSESFVERGLRAAVAVIILAGAGWIVIERRPALREFGVEWREGAWHEVSLVRPGELVSRIERFRAGPAGTVIIKQKTDSGDRLVCVDDQLVASTNLEARVDAMMLAHLPLLLHPNPKSELTVGFGSGGTSYAITTHGIDAWCVEIEPEVPRAAELLTQQNLDVLGHPRFRLIINDARGSSDCRTAVVRCDRNGCHQSAVSAEQQFVHRGVFSADAGRLNPGGIACGVDSAGGDQYERAANTHARISENISARDAVVSEPHAYKLRDTDWNAGTAAGGLWTSGVGHGDSGGS